MSLIDRAAAFVARNLSTPGRRAGAALVWLGLLAPFRPLLLPDEAKYTDIARWMALSRDFLIPRIDGLPFLHIPPLTYWLEALGIGAFGPNLLTARLVALASALLLCRCLHDLTERHAGPDAARWTLLAALTSPLFYGAAQFANMDLAVTALITLAIDLGLRAAVVERTGSRRWLALGAWGAMGLALLAKGLIGLLVPALVLGASAVFLRRPGLLRGLASVSGAIAFLALALPWFLLVERQIPGFLRYWFSASYIEPYLAPNASHSMGPWFYPALLVGGLAPWSLGAMIEAWCTSREVGLRDRAGPPRETATARDLRTIALFWLAIVVIGQSLSPVKHAGLIIPALPPALLLIGPLVARARGRELTAALAGLACLAIGIFVTLSTKTGPVDLAKRLRGEIAPGDRVVFVGRYQFDAAIAMDRKSQIYIVDDWATPSASLPDSLKRQLSEGRDFDPRAGAALVDPAGLAQILAPPGRAWVFIDAGAADGFTRAHDLEIVARSPRHAVLRSKP